MPLCLNTHLFPFSSHDSCAANGELNHKIRVLGIYGQCICVGRVREAYAFYHNSIYGCRVAIGFMGIELSRW